MDDADRVCRLPDDEWQDYDISYASEIKKKSEALLLSYACINCDTMLCLIDQQMEDLPLRKSDESRVVDGLYNANKFQNFKIEGVGPDGKPAEAQRDSEQIMRWPPFKVRVNEGCYERRFRMACKTCARPFGYRMVTEDSQISKFGKAKQHPYSPFDRLTFVMPSKLKIINLRTDRAKIYTFKKSTTDRGKTATTTVSTIEKDAAEVEQSDQAFAFHTNIAIIKNEMHKRGVIKRKLQRVEEEEEIFDEQTGLRLGMKDVGDGSDTKRRRDRGTLGVDSEQV